MKETTLIDRASYIVYLEVNYNMIGMSNPQN